MLGVLIEIFRGNAVTTGRGFPRKRDVAFKNLMCATADSYVGAVAVERLIALRRSLLLLEGPVAGIVTARPLTWS